MTRNALALAAAVLFGLFASACQSSVSGQVFFDKNGNGIYDTSDAGVPFAKLMITRDSKLVAEYYSDTTGAFAVPIRSKTGYVCVETDLSFSEANFNYIVQSLNTEAAAKTMTVTPPKALMAPDVVSPGDTGDTEEDQMTEEEDDLEPTYTEQAQADGWKGSRYCQNVKYKGFEVDIPVTMDFTEALDDMPTRLKTTCYAGQECEVRIPYPKGCTLEPLSLPEGLTLDQSEAQAGVKGYDRIFNIVSFKPPSTSAEKAQVGGATFAPGGFSMVTLKLKADADAKAGSTDVKIEPTADCFGDELALHEIPVEIVREISAAVYQHLMTLIGPSGMLNPGTNAAIRVLVENRGRSAITKGDLTFLPPAGSILQSTEGCLNYGTKLICRVDNIDPGALHPVDITFKLPSPAVDETVSCEASFIADGMESQVEADYVTFKVNGST